MRKSVATSRTRGNTFRRAERTARAHTDRFWAITLACQKERGVAPTKATKIGVRVIRQPECLCLLQVSATALGFCCLNASRSDSIHGT